MTIRRTGLTIAVVALGGCMCDGDRVTETGYASTLVYGPQIAACITDRDCELLCADRFGLGDDVDIERCEITAVERRAPGTSSGASVHRDAVFTRAIATGAPGATRGASFRKDAVPTQSVEPQASGTSSTMNARGELVSTRMVEPRGPATSTAAGGVDDLALVVGVTLRVTYVVPAPCEFGIDVGAGDDGWSDDPADDSSDDGSTDDGSDDDPGDDDWDDDPGDDGSDDGDDGDDGDTGDDGGDDGGGDDGGGDDGGGDDGGGDDGGGDGGGDARTGGGHRVRVHAAPSTGRPSVVAAGAIGLVIDERPGR